MKIIDKNKDFYDYFQNIYRDDTLTFDRRDSEIWSNDKICGLLYGKNVEDFIYVMIRVGYARYLIKLTVVEKGSDFYFRDYVKDYSVELISKWKDYNHLEKLDFGKVKGDYDFNRVGLKNLDKKSLDLILDNRYKFDTCCFGRCYWRDNELTEEKFHYPIFMDSKIPKIIDPFEFYTNIEEWLSKLKEENYSDKQSDVEKIESHGFDKKSSFRSVK